MLRGAVSQGDNRGAGAGGILRTHDGQIIEIFSFHLGSNTVNYAELWALWKGLKIAVRRCVEALIIETDSQFVVQAVNACDAIEAYHPNIQNIINKLFAPFKKKKKYPGRLQNYDSHQWLYLGSRLFGQIRSFK